MIPAGPVFHKPKSFITAKNILYASIFLGVLAIIIRDFIFDNKNKNWLLSLLIAFVGYVIIILLIKQAGLCKKWARTVLTAWLILFIVSSVITFADGYIMNIIESTLAGLQAALEIIALVFLYKEECNTWFNSSKDEILQK
jgi:NADH:ubiquinone oxidoreductase subunit 6 (subunit J)